MEELPAFAGLIGAGSIEEHEQKRLLKKLDSDDEDYAVEQEEQLDVSNKSTESIGNNSVNRSEQ